MNKNMEIIEGKLVTLGYGGQALYKNKGIVLFVPRGLPGDIVQLRVKKFKKKYGSAEIQKIITPSPDRITPVCDAFIKGCGGCQWLNFKYESQLLWKARIIRETLKHIGKININLKEIIAMKNPYQYRNKLSLHRNEKEIIGLMKEKSYEIIPFKFCHQELNTNQQVYEKIKNSSLLNKTTISQIHIRSNIEGEAGIYFFNDHCNNKFYKMAMALRKEIKELKGVGLSTHRNYYHLAGETSLKQKIKEITYHIPLNSFFQINYQEAEVLLEVVEKFLNPQKNDKILDLYCGVGFFTLPLAQKVKEAFGVENNSLSVEYAKYSAKENKITNAQFECMDVKFYLKKFKKKSVNAIILDPPRAGCDKEVLTEIIRISPEKIIYVSCAPDTLSRDLQLLNKNGYKIGPCQPVDMFPHTYHVETVTYLYL